MAEPLQQDLFTLLHDVARLIRVEADRRARVHGLTRAQWAFVKALHHHPGITQKEMADLLDVEPISVARLVDRMEAAGLVERRPDEQDRRIWRLHLLPTATSLLCDIELLRESLSAFVTDGITGAQHDVMLAGLRRMKANLQGSSHTNHDEYGRGEPAGEYKESA